MISAIPNACGEWRALWRDLAGRCKSVSHRRDLKHLLTCAVFAEKVSVATTQINTHGLQEPGLGAEVLWIVFRKRMRSVGRIGGMSSG